MLYVHHYTQTRVDFQQIFEHPSVHESGNFCKYWAIPQFFQVLSIPYVKVASLDRKQTTALRFGWMRRLFSRSVFFALSQVTADFPSFARMHASRCESEWNGYALEFLPAFLPFA